MLLERSSERLARPVRRLRVALAAALLALPVLAAEPQHRPLRTGGLSAETAALLLSGQEGGSIPLFALAVTAAADGSSRAPVELFVEAPGAAVLAGHEEESVRLELCLYALEGARVAAASLETVELDLARDGERLLEGGLKAWSRLELAAGSYRLRLLLRNVQTGQLGLRSLSIEVPAAGAGPALQAPLVPDASPSWLRLTRNAGSPITGFWPAARPVLAPDRDAEMQVLVQGLDPDLARIELSGAEGASIEVPASVSPAEAAAGGFDRWLVRARLPLLDPGDYEIGLRVGEANSSPRLPVVVRSGGGETWASAGAAAPVPALSPEFALPGVGDRRGRKRAVASLTRQLESDYRGALTRLAAADIAGAVAELARMEASAFEQEGGAAAVAAAEMGTARALVESAGGSLVPLFDLHYRAYKRYLASQSFRLSSHARDTLLGLVELHLEREPDGTAPATDILVVLANQLQQSGLARYSRVVFRRALQIDPTHEGALLGLAAGLEKHGEYPEACEMLERLLAAQPGHREAALRLAVNLTRGHDQARGRRLFEKLIEGPEQDWVAAVAYQELARDLIDRERLAEAETLLAAARQRLPEDDQLRLLLASVEDARRTRKPGGSLVLRSRADRPSARHRYQQWPRYRPRSPAGESEVRLQALAAALQGLRSAA